MRRKGRDKPVNFATSDIHGYPLDLLIGLLEKAGFGPSDHLYVIGDVIDRNGDGGVATLRWMMKQPNVTLIRGNHEVMMLKCGFLFDQDLENFSGKDLSPQQQHDLLLWHQNGAMVTIRNLAMLRAAEPEELKTLMEYVRSAPLYVELTAGPNRFVLVHGGFKDFEPQKRPDEYTEDDLVWTRPDEERYWEDRLVILGHTPTQYYGKKGRMFVTDTWIDIDTGSAGGGSPMILRLEDLKAFYAENGTEKEKNGE